MSRIATKLAALAAAYGGLAASLKSATDGLDDFARVWLDKPAGPKVRRSGVKARGKARRKANRRARVAARSAK